MSARLFAPRAGALALAAALGATAAQANLITNGGFESAAGFVDNEPAIDSVMNLHPGDTALPGWIVSGGEVAWGRSGAYDITTPYGLYSLDLTGYERGAPGTVSQTFATVAGQAYDVSFRLGYGSGTNRNPIFWGPNHLRAVVSNGGTALFSGDFSSGQATSGQVTQWDGMRFRFVAVSASTTLSFTGLPSGQPPGTAALIGLDEVSVLAAVPEPASAALLLGGLVLLAARRRASVSASA